MPTLDFKGKQFVYSHHLSEQTEAVERACKALQEELDTIGRLPAALLRRAFEGGL